MKLDRKLADMMLVHLKDAPPGETQVSQAVRDLCVATLVGNHTDAEVYDILAGISERDDVSDFIKAMCNVRQFYDRPSEITLQETPQTNHPPTL